MQHPPKGPNANHAWQPGLMTEDDLRDYTAPYRKPTRIDYKGLDVWSMGPPSSGGSTVGEALNILEGYRPLGADRTQALHRYLEASRYAFADRNAYLGRPRLRRRAAALPALRRLRGRAAGADHEHGGHEPVSRRRLPASARPRRPSPARARRRRI